MTSDWEDGIADLTQRLVTELSNGNRVLWLVSGGSNIQASVKVINNIPGQLTKNLSVMPVDERYGPPGHDNSNWAQLLKTGFKTAEATTYPVLQDGLDFNATAQRFAELAAKAFDDSQVTIAQLGIGEDGHVAGILPNSPAAEERESLVFGYEAGPYQRLTLTFPALLKIDATYAFAFGGAKQPALQALYEGTQDIIDLPSRILCEIPEAYVYNDQVGET
jgi:6-phosphogluconolactonase/glucosamine-6-phosphate isomerase/deaminase